MIIYSKTRINRIRLPANPILIVVSWTGKIIFLSPFAPENLVSRDGFGSPVPRQPAHLHTQAESYQVCIWTVIVCIPICTVVQKLLSNINSDTFNML